MGSLFTRFPSVLFITLARHSLLPPFPRSDRVPRNAIIKVVAGHEHLASICGICLLVPRKSGLPQMSLFFSSCLPLSRKSWLSVMTTWAVLPPPSSRFGRFTNVIAGLSRSASSEPREGEDVQFSWAHLKPPELDSTNAADVDESGVGEEEPLVNLLLMRIRTSHFS